MKIKPLLLAALLALSISSVGCSENAAVSGKADSSSVPETVDSEAVSVNDTNSDNADSSSAPEIVDDESAFMKAAPAYDTEKAKSYISGMSEIRELLNSAKAERELTSFKEIKAPDAAIKKVKDEITKLTADVHKVSLIMVDLETKSGVAYAPDIAMCTQSTIKAVYLGSVLDSHPEAYNEHSYDFNKAIVNSNTLAFYIQT